MHCVLDSVEDSSHFVVPGPSRPSKVEYCIDPSMNACRSCDPNTTPGNPVPNPKIVESCQLVPYQVIAAPVGVKSRLVIWIISKQTKPKTDSSIT